MGPRLLGVPLAPAGDAGSTAKLFQVSSFLSPSGPGQPDEIDMTSPANHLDFAAILPLFPRLERLILCFQTKRCGVDFRWNMFGLTEKERSQTQTEEP